LFIFISGAHIPVTALERFCQVLIFFDHRLKQLLKRIALRHHLFGFPLLFPLVDYPLLDLGYRLVHLQLELLFVNQILLLLIVQHLIELLGLICLSLPLSLLLRFLQVMSCEHFLLFLGRFPQFIFIHLGFPNFHIFFGLNLVFEVFPVFLEQLFTHFFLCSEPFLVKVDVDLLDTLVELHQEGPLLDLSLLYLLR